jgi:hypothetical protein
MSLGYVVPLIGIEAKLISQTRTICRTRHPDPARSGGSPRIPCVLGSEVANKDGATPGSSVGSHILHR